jgi:hypothetical protein
MKRIFTTNYSWLLLYVLFMLSSTCLLSATSNACLFQAYLGDFIVSKQANGTVLVKWTTISEHNNEYFSIERSTDGVHYAEIGKISSFGNTAYGFSYRFIDNKPGIGKNFYKICMVDIANKHKYSEIKLVQVNDHSQQVLSVFPNPAVNAVSLKINTKDNEELKVEIYSVTGIKELAKTCIIQDQKTALNIENLKTGIYEIVVVTSIGMEYTSKLIILK